MLRSITLLTVCLAVVLSHDASAVAQDAAQIQIETEDVFDQLVPLIEASNAAAEEQGEATPVPSQPTPTPATPTPATPTRATPTPATPRTPTVPSIDTPVDADLAPSQPAAAVPAVGSNDSDIPARVQALLNLPAQQTGQARAAGQYGIGGKLTALSRAELHQLIGIAAKGLSADLSTVQQGEHWQEFLQLAQLERDFGTAPSADEPTLDGSRLLQLQTVKGGYDKVAADGRYQLITRQYKFQVLHQALAEALTGDEDRQQRQGAYEDITQLRESFRPVPSAHQWREYFELDQLERLLTSPRELTPAEREQLQLVLSRFDKAATTPAYRGVVALGGFDETYRRLRSATAVIPNDEVRPIAEDDLPGREAEEDESPRISLITESGIAFHRDYATDGWQLANGVVSLQSASAIKTNERGTARVTIGTNCEIVCLPDSLLQITQYVDEEGVLVTQLNSEAGDLKLVRGAAPDLSPDEDQAPEHRIAIVHNQHHIVAGGGQLELDLRHVPETNRVIAAVYAGAVTVHQPRTGDQVNIRAGREAVMLPAGIAVRAAAEKPVSWWPQRPTRTADESDEPSPR